MLDFILGRNSAYKSLKGGLALLARGGGGGGGGRTNNSRKNLGNQTLSLSERHYLFDCLPSRYPRISFFKIRSRIVNGVFLTDELF